MQRTTLKKLKKRQDFLRVAKIGKKVVKPAFILVAARNFLSEENQTSRIGYTATKKIGNAVIRNRSKRRLRAIVRERLVSQAHPNIDYNLIARFSTQDYDYDKLIADFDDAIVEIHKQLDK